MMTSYNGAVIENNKVVLVHANEGGIQSRYAIGVAQARRDIKQIEASPRPLAESTKARLAALKEGVALWEGR